MKIHAGLEISLTCVQKKGPRCWPGQDYCFVYLDFNFPTTFHILIFNGNILHYSSFIDSVLRFSSDQQEQ